MTKRMIVFWMLLFLQNVAWSKDETLTRQLDDAVNTLPVLFSLTLLDGEKAGLTGTLDDVSVIEGVVVSIATSAAFSGTGLAFSASNLPGVLPIDSNSGEITGIAPDVDSTTTSAVIVTVTAADGSTASAAFNLMVFVMYTAHLNSGILPTSSGGCSALLIPRGTVLDTAQNCKDQCDITATCVAAAWSGTNCVIYPCTATTSPGSYTVYTK